MNRLALLLALTSLATTACDDDLAYAYGAPAAPDAPAAPVDDVLAQHGVNGFTDPADDNLVTFAIDVDTGSYTLMRSAVEAGRLPTPATVRVEEFVNYFDYRDRPPADRETPFAIHTEVGPSPFGDGLHLMRVALKGYEVAAEDRLRANLVFLVDVSGSMMSGNKIGLVREGLNRLTETLHPDDTIGIVTYAGADTIALEPTPVRHREAIQRAIDALQAGGSTNGEAGIRTAYRLADRVRIDGGINRVILCSDGDFNVGLTGTPLIDLIDGYRELGVNLSVFGFGQGNYNDAEMEQLADHGDGNYAFIDNTSEVERVMVDGLGGTLQTIAKDVKVQVEVDPAHVARYRLMGYENRDIADEDFRNDPVDAGEIGAGHTVTAFIELELRPGADAAALARVRIRYKAPGADAQAEATEIARTVRADEVISAISETSDAYRFGAAVVEFAEILRSSPYSEGNTFDNVATMAERSAVPGDRFMVEFAALVRRAATL